MAENSRIEWTDHTFNPWIGCQKIGPGCDHCYAETWDKRAQGERWGAHAERTRTKPSNWARVRSWDDKASAAGERHRVFVASLADVCDTHPSIEPSWREELARLVEGCPHLDFLFLTKRAGNIERVLGDMFPSGAPGNLWMGITVVNQEEADRDVVKLLRAKEACGFPVAFLSIEPMLGGIDLTDLAVREGKGAAFRLNALTGEFYAVDALPGGTPWTMEKIDWAIVGGESGRDARPMHPAWARRVLRACEHAGVPALFKQWGEWAPMDFPTEAPADATDETAFRRLSFYGEDSASGWPMARIGKAVAGREIEGRTWDGSPEPREPADETPAPS